MNLKPGVKTCRYCDVSQGLPTTCTVLHSEDRRVFIKYERFCLVRIYNTVTLYETAAIYMVYAGLPWVERNTPFVILNFESEFIFARVGIDSVVTEMPVIAM
jgi:hypothetical protein